MKTETPEQLRRDLITANTLLAASRGSVPIGLELSCINLARRVYQACLPSHDLSWLIQLPSNSWPALLFLIQESARQLDTCQPPPGGAPKIRPTIKRRSAR